jgi:murein DD-endopeptidase MepM/ murein hydrolase activator NlpD
MIVPRPSISLLELSRCIRLYMTRLAPLAAVASAGLILWHAARDTPPDTRSAAAAPLVYPANGPGPKAPASPPPSRNAPLAVRQASVAATIEVVVGRNDTLEAIFKRMALDPGDLAAIRHLPGIRQSLDFLRPGDAIKLTHHDGSVKELTRKVSETKTLHVVRDEAGFAANVTENPVQTRIRTASASIDSSLFQAAESAHISDMVALRLANIFAWDIDFVLDIRDGDTFKAVYEQVYQDGKYLRDGDILAAEFVNGGKVYRAVRFVDEGGAVGYYTPDGQPMRKAFLRAPVEFTRVSSAFNPNRLHPILNIIRGHMGTDYAAPIGTPVHAAGDGHVTFEGVRGGYGNAIVLSHSADTQTLYGHMLRFAGGVHLGSHVQQGEVIGYVGMTGLATGPHLHYEYLMNGVHKDPQTVKLPGADPLRAESMGRFRTQTAPWLADLSEGEISPVQQAGLAQPPVRDLGEAPGVPGAAGAVEDALGAASVLLSAAGGSRFPGAPSSSVN